MRLELKRIKGKRTNRKIDNLIISEGELSYLVKNAEFGVDLENIDLLIVTDSPEAQLATLQAENERLKVILAESVRAISFDQLCRYLELDPAEYTSFAKVDDIRQRIIEEARAALG